MEEVIAELLIGAFLIFISYQIGCKGNIQLVHSYHYTNLSKENKQQFTKWLGIGNFLVGLGVFCIPIINWILGHDIGDYFGLAAMIAGVAIMVWTIIKYNGALISFKK